MTVQQEFLATCWQDAQPLLIAHHNEAVGQGSVRPDRALCEVLETINALRLFTMRDAGRLAGYAIFVITPSTHQEGRTVALCDGIYIDPRNRSFASVRRLWRFAEACLVQDGVKEVRAHASVGSALGSLFRRFGYTLAETVHIKVL